MALPAPRRRIATYGKGAKRSLVHDLFDVGAQYSHETPTIAEKVAEPQRSAKSVADSETRQGPAQTLARATEREHPDNGQEQDEAESEDGNDRDEKIATSSLTSSSPRIKSNLSMFDIESSDDPSSAPEVKPVIKKRKMGSENKAIAQQQKAEPITAYVSRRGRDGDERMVKSQGHRQATVVQPKKRRSPTPSAASTSLKTLKTKANLSTQNHVVESLSDSVVGVRPRHAPSAAHALSKRPAAKGRGRTSRESSVPLSKPLSSPRKAGRPTTPKRNRESSDDESAVAPSPSDLQMRSLRLTPGIEPRLSQRSSTEETISDHSPEPKAVRRGRKRLIDQLDGPRAQSQDLPKAGPQKAHESSTGTRSQSAIDTSVAGGDQATGPSSIVSFKEHARPTSSNSGLPKRQRATYATQRSHLSDVLDESDSFPLSLSQGSSVPDFSQSQSFTSLTSHKDAFELESDEAETSSRVKSIHELRRGAAITKFDLDLHSILDDIESGSTTLRIEGLLQLLLKLKELLFLRHFRDSSSFPRFVAAAGEELDTVAAIMMCRVCASILTAERPTPKILHQVLGALCRVPASLLTEDRSLVMVAKDPRHQLPRGLVRAIKDLEVSSTKTGGSPPRSVGLMVLQTIESASRNLIMHKEPLPDLPPLVLEQIILALGRHQKSEGDKEADGRAERAELVQTLVALLEILSASHRLSGTSLPSSLLRTLADSLTYVMEEARGAQPQMEHSCLRLIVSLSNNDLNVCRAFVQQSLIVTVFQVIDDHFSTLAALAASEQEFDHSRLESVILAVGCLLNLVECADEARLQILELDLHGQSLLDRLVHIFNAHVDAASEALTIDQTQILVAFGYIAALLCTLSLNDRVRQHITRSIRGEDLSQLFSAADTFLDHLRTVEAALSGEGGEGGGGTTQEFTARFTVVLTSVKQQAG